jgi:hypothetical protein
MLSSTFRICESYRRDAPMTPEQYERYAEFANAEDCEADCRESDGPSWNEYVREQYAEATRLR